MTTCCVLGKHNINLFNIIIKSTTVAHHRPTDRRRRRLGTVLLYARKPERQANGFRTGPGDCFTYIPASSAVVRHGRNRAYTAPSARIHENTRASPARRCTIYLYSERITSTLKIGCA